MQYPLSVSLLFFAVSGVACAAHSHPQLAFASAGGVEEAPAVAPLLPAAPAAKPTSPSDGRVVLITIDGVRPEDVFEGADPGLRPGAKVEHLARPEAVMPRLHRLVAKRGVALGADRPGCGMVRTASGANVSLPGYLEIFTGRKTRCRDNGCARTELTTVLDEASDAGLTPVASIGSWDYLDRAVTGVSLMRARSKVLVAEGVLPWPAPRPPRTSKIAQLITAGEGTAAFPGIGKYRPDVHTSAIALEYLRTASPPVLHVGLGDADEWGHRNDYASYLGALAKTDAFIGDVADTLAGMGEAGARTTVIVTTDHGRNRDFQHHGALSLTAGRTFVAAFGGGMAGRGRGVVCPSRDVTLADIAPTVRVLLGLPADVSPDAGRPIEEILGTEPLASATPSSPARASP